MHNTRGLQVLLDGGSAAPIPVGNLWLTSGRAATFAYDPTWLTHPHRFAPEPALPLTDRRFHTESGQTLFRCFTDALPQRWAAVFSHRMKTPPASPALYFRSGADRSLGRHPQRLRVIADAIRAYGAQPDADLPELWTRLVFNSAIANTDDHLRNHGFVREAGGWRLSLVYDLEISPGTTHPTDLESTLSVADYFGLTPEQAEATLPRLLPVQRRI